jgi:predicted GNAT family acetyltransferase
MKTPFRSGSPNERAYKAAIDRGVKTIAGSDRYVTVIHTAKDPQTTMAMIKIFDLDTTVDYRGLQSDMEKFDTRLPYGPLRAGDLIISDSAQGGSFPLLCQDDINVVVPALHRAGYQVGKTYHVAWSKIEPSLKGKGFGKILYKTALAYIASKAAKGRVPLLTADYCVKGETSSDARKIYVALRKEFFGHGLVLTPLTSDKSPRVVQIPKPVTTLKIKRYR